MFTDTIYSKDIDAHEALCEFCGIDKYTEEYMRNDLIEVQSLRDPHYFKVLWEEGLTEIIVREYNVELRNSKLETMCYNLRTVDLVWAGDTVKCLTLSMI